MTSDRCASAASELSLALVVADKKYADDDSAGERAGAGALGALADCDTQVRAGAGALLRGDVLRTGVHVL